jgi:uncharacterized SAM-dependent methyltransferase
MNNNKIFEDYYKFLTTAEGADILPYAYLIDSNSYEKLIKTCKDYYLFDDEVALIKNNSLKLKHYLNDITNIIEIGPGSNHTVINKTVPFLQYAKKLEGYFPLDLCENYLTDTCNIVSANIPNLKIKPIEHDIMSSSPLKLSNNLRNKALIILGGTLGNFNEEEQSNILTLFHNSLKEGDLLFITFDSNLEKESLLKAYSNNLACNLLRGGLNYFSSLYQDLLEHKAKFEVCCTWNEQQQYIDLFFTAKENLTLYLPNNNIVKIQEGQEFRGIKSRKYDKNKIESLLNKCKLSVIDILDNSQKMQIFICKRY